MKSLKASISQYLTIRRSLGYKLKTTESHLRAFAEFLREKRCHTVRTALVLDWIGQFEGASKMSQAQRLSVIRRFAEFRKITDPDTEVPPKNLLPYRPQRAVPHIYSRQELCVLLRAVRAAPTTTLRRSTFYMIIGLLAVTGCRVGEILGLAAGDADLQKRFLTIRNAKFGKSRIVPLHPTVVQELKHFLRVQQSCLGNVTPRRLFVSRHGNPVDAGDLKHFFIKLSKEVGIRKTDARQGPRLHDLRHSFAVKTILRWYKSGADVEALMPLLSTYLGHVKPSDTYWYLTGVPELLNLAAKRLATARRGA